MQTDSLIQTFLAEHGHTVPGSTVTASDFVGAVRQWCRDRSRTAPRRRAILSAIRGLGYPVGRTSTQLAVGNLSLTPKSLTVDDSGRLVPAHR